jgi:hypothetical protein
MAAVDPERSSEAPAETFKVTDRRRQADESESSEASRPRPPEPGREPVRTLSGLFMMLATSAMMALGDVPDPMTGKTERHLDQATALIDLLMLLRDKTEGHRIPEETEVLEGILYDLQTRYIAATKRS